MSRLVTTTHPDAGGAQGAQGVVTTTDRTGGPSMFRAIVATQWKWSRMMVLLAVVAGFALPLLTLQSAHTSLFGAADPRQFLSAIAMWSPAYALASSGLGLLVALIAWSPDHRGRHVYALTLPVPRWRYALMRFAAGALFLVPPTAALLAGALLASRSGAVPVGLHAYPVAMTLRFGFAALVAFAIFFAIASATVRTAGWILGSFAVLVGAQLLLSNFGTDVDLLGRFANVVFVSPGLLAVFSGQWMLIDV